MTQAVALGQARIVQRAAHVGATIAAILLSVSTARASDCTRDHDPRYVYAAQVARIYDGDTVFMDIDLGFRMWLRNEPLRLWAVDTPEVRGKTKAAGLAVRDLVATWISPGTETLIRTLKDKHGANRTGSFRRYLAIICPPGWAESVNARLLREGHAQLRVNSERERREAQDIFGLDR